MGANALHTYFASTRFVDNREFLYLNIIRYRNHNMTYSLVVSERRQVKHLLHTRIGSADGLTSGIDLAPDKSG
ncbi:hypothetical protein CHR55_27730 [Rhodococcus qingshengii]|uniref:Uncharacterized protein n=1 Tax=Rhodococcus qingshengii TaxID=334542 RepID=A0A2A5J3F8_RHOSG|nr:hypothetical protein CHR55_27730 [Rhodococcus qingshengii]